MEPQISIQPVERPSFLQSDALRFPAYQTVGNFLSGKTISRQDLIDSLSFVLADINENPGNLNDALLCDITLEQLRQTMDWALVEV